MSDDVQAHIKLYWKIGIALLVLTVVTVAISYVDFGVPLAVTVALIIAATKGSLVGSYFMHLVGERKSILATLLLTGFFFLLLIFLPLLGHTNTFGKKMIFPNANASVASEEAH